MSNREICELSEAEFIQRVESALSEIEELGAINFKLKKNYCEDIPLYVSLYTSNYGENICVNAFLKPNDKLEALFGEHLDEITTEYELFVFFADKLNRQLKTLQNERDKAVQASREIVKGRKIVEEDGEYFDLYMEKEDMQRIASKVLEEVDNA